MRENKNEITGLFRNRLANAEMTVRDGFWEQLQEGLLQAEAADGKAAATGTSPAATERKKPIVLSPGFYRVAAAASVVLVLGAASAAFWYFSPKEEIKEAFTQVAALTPEGSLNGDVVQESFPSIREASPTAQKPGMKQPASGVPAGLTAETDNEDETVSVHVSITITQRVYGNRQIRNNCFDNSAIAQADNCFRNAIGNTDISSEHTAVSTEKNHISSLKKTHNWALKAALGTLLPKGDYHMPLTAEVTAERSLNNWLAVETGLRYNRLHDDRNTLHTLGIPVKLNMTLASTPKVDVYATVGGAAEKCIAGAADNGFGAEPIKLSVAAGVGVRYKLSDRFALFAEPSVSHHFDTDSGTRTLRTERPTNLNLLCGVRMTY